MAVERMTLGDIAALLDGRLDGDAEIEISEIAPIQDAKRGAISFVSNRKYIRQLETTRASAVLASEEVAALPRAEGLSLVILDDPYMGFARLLRHWTHVPRQVTGVSEKAHVDPSATIGADVNIDPFVFVGPGASIGDRVDVHAGAYVGRDAKIGPDTSLGPNCVIHHEAQVGAHCVIYAGAVIGSDGFGFAPDFVQGLHVKIPQTGTTVIEDHVEIGANVTIDRPSMGVTRIARGTKIDNLVQIGHSVSVGMGCFLAAQVGISGSTKVGNGVSIGGQAGLAGHMNVADGVQIAAKAGIHKDLTPGERVFGFLAEPVDKAMRSYAIFNRLPQLRKRVRQLERRLQALENGSD